MSAPDHTQFLRALEARSFLKTVAYSEQQLKANRVGAHPDIVAFEKKFIAKLVKLDIPVYAHNMVRTPAEQEGMWVRGVSRIRGHQPYSHKGCAVDIVHSIHHWNISEGSWKMLGFIGKELAKQNGIEIDWGGDWKDFYDPAHWQLSQWKTLIKGFPYAEPEKRAKAVRVPHER